MEFGVAWKLKGGLKNELNWNTYKLALHDFLIVCKTRDLFRN